MPDVCLLLVEMGPPWAARIGPRLRAAPAAAGLVAPAWAAGPGAAVVGRFLEAPHRYAAHVAQGLILPQDLVEHGHRCADLLCDAVEAKGAAVVLSADDAAMMTPAELAALRRGLGTLFRELRVLVALKRPETVCAEGVEDLVRGGLTLAQAVPTGAEDGTGNGQADGLRRRDAWPRYRAPIEALRAAFGADAVAVVDAETDAAAEPAVAAALARWGLPAAALAAPPPPPPARLSAAALEALSRFNAATPALAEGAPSPRRGADVAAWFRFSPGAPWAPDAALRATLRRAVASDAAFAAKTLAAGGAADAAAAFALIPDAPAAADPTAAEVERALLEALRRLTLEADKNRARYQAFEALELGGDPAAQTARLESALRLCKDAGFLKSIGAWLERAGLHGPARDFFAKALTLAPDDPQLHLRLGATLAALGRPRDAARAFGAAAARRPRLTAALLGQARALAAAGRLDAAQNAARTAAARAPADAEAAALFAALQVQTAAAALRTGGAAPDAPAAPQAAPGPAPAAAPAAAPGTAS